jgi:hypothetical protein
MATPWSDEATTRFLDAVTDDLQRQLGAVGVIHDVTAHPAGGGHVTLVAWARIGQRSYRISGSGENLVAAYAELRRDEPELALAAAYRELAETLR